MDNFRKAPKSIKIITLVIALASIAAPVLFALNQSWHQGQAEELKKVLAYAKNVQQRTDATADQVAHGIKRLLDAHLANPCSKQGLAIMRSIDLSSSYIQAIGYVSKDAFECSSIDAHRSGWSLGPLSFVSLDGVVFRNKVNIPYAPNMAFTVVERNGFAAIINKNSPINITTLENDVSLATFSQDNHQIIESQGIIKPEWMNELGEKTQVTFFKGGYVVAVVKSTKYRSAALAALPVVYMDRQTRNLGIVLVPIGLLTGILFACAIFYLAKIQISMPALLRGALKNDEFFMLYQPMINLQTGEWVGAEALIRWRRPSGEMIPPEIFIKVAEEAGLVQRITKRVIRLVCRDATNVFKTHPNFHLSINFAAADMHSSQTMALLRDLILETGAGPDNLIVEATERGFMHADIAREMITEIRKIGVGIAIDDFGTGYSSLSYLETLKIDYLKIDKSFVDKIGTQAITSSVVLHIIAMAKQLNMKLVAEGVETEVQAEFLRDHGVQYAQGWLYGKPMQFEDFIRQLPQPDISQEFGSRLT